MSRKRSVPLGTIETLSADGAPVTLEVEQTQIELMPGQWRGGLKSLSTLDGLHVNRLEPGRYEVVQTGQVLTADDEPPWMTD